MDSQTPLQKAIVAAGSQQNLANQLGIRSASISEWKSRGRIPVERVRLIESVTGISKHELRPDIFGPNPAPAACEQGDSVKQVSAGITKRSLRAKLGLANDAGLAVLLKLPRDQVDAWGEDEHLPALPAVLALVEPPPINAPKAPSDLDADRIVQIETS
ncbi:helix-turn-helix domain-containing protein [Xanthomonas sp. 4461]|uniref:transcriptional regulator n=1 Tax=Xanthomonas sp. 4461 TaxID=3035313 RepID=UPI0021670ECB|nr:helix-turn-helix domain-containing protein [Xanthomonas sp. 4461]MCS3807837.1 DNA-binding transcriptional regulator YdaS (Cro superfamily) [Xanthomonas sp. 4461]